MATQHAVRVSTLALALLIAAACAAGVQTAREGPTGSQDVIVRSELEAAVASNALEAVQELRPQWLRRSGPTSVLEPAGNLPSVYIDNMRAGELDALRDVPVQVIEEIRLVSPADATNRWGTGLVGGVIWVIRKTQ